MTEFRIQNSDKTNGEPVRGSPWSFLNSEFCILNSVIFAVTQSVIEPVRRLDQERVVRVQCEQILEVPRSVERRGLVDVAEPALLPHEEDRRARAILPPHDRVRVQLLVVEA